MKTITTVEIVCCSCGTTFAMDETLKALRQRDGGGFYCPNGHGQRFAGSAAEQLKTVREELAQAKAELEEARVEIRQLKCAALAPEPQRKTLLQRLGVYPVKDDNA